MRWQNIKKTWINGNLRRMNNLTCQNIKCVISETSVKSVFIMNALSINKMIEILSYNFFIFVLGQFFLVINVDFLILITSFFLFFLSIFFYAGAIYNFFLILFYLFSMFYVIFGAIFSHDDLLLFFFNFFFFFSY